MHTKSELGALVSDLIPGKVEYAVLFPPGYHSVGEQLPLLLNMHGGGLDRSYILDADVRSMYQRLWDQGALPPMVVACYSARGSLHLNYRDGSERWEDFAFEFMRFVQKTYNTRLESAYNYLVGLSMGALGALRLTLKYPDRFGAVAALEAAINPVFNYEDLAPRNYGLQHNSPQDLQKSRWGWPVDPHYYRANNHPNIVRVNAAAIRAKKPKIYLECGDRDYFNAHDGSEFLHRILWEHRIEHEYRLLHDCDHVGRSLVWRMEDAHRWLGRMASKLIDPRPLPEPTPEQQEYLNRAYRGEATRHPTRAEKLPLTADAAILAHRRALPDFLAAYADDPLGGVFRSPSG